MKQTRVLAEKLNQSGPDELLDVVLELGGEAAQELERADSMDAMRAAYAGLVRPIKEKVSQLGGSVTGEAWLNGTLQVQLPSKALEGLESEASIALADLPREIERD